jgi:hypothetical protein
MTIQSSCDDSTSAEIIAIGIIGTFAI